MKVSDDGATCVKLVSGHVNFLKKLQYFGSCWFYFSLQVAGGGKSNLLGHLLEVVSIQKMEVDLTSERF